MMSKSPRAFESINRNHLMTFFAIIMSGIFFHVIGGIIVLIWVFSDDGNAGKLPTDGFFYGPLIGYVAFHGMVVISSLITVTLSISGLYRENNNLLYNFAASSCKYLIGISGIAASVCAILKVFIIPYKLGSQWALYYIQIVSITLIGFGIFGGIIVGVLIYRRLSRQSRMIPSV